MAITWDVKITVLNVDRKEVSVQAIRTDDTDVDNILTETYDIPWTEIATQAQKNYVLDQIWSMRVATLAYSDSVGVIVGNLEEQAKQNLESREQGV